MRETASGMARLCVGLPAIFAGVVGIYQRHDFAGEKRKTLELWGNHVATVVGDGSARAKVVGLR